MKNLLSRSFNQSSLFVVLKLTEFKPKNNYCSPIKARKKTFLKLKSFAVLAILHSDSSESLLINNM